MNKKEKSIVKRERQLKQHIHWALKSFDKTQKEKGFPGNRSTGVWFGKLSDKLHHFTPTRKEIIPQLLAIYVSWKSLTQEQANALQSQCNSPDREDWYMAFLTIKCLKPYKIKK